MKPYLIVVALIISISFVHAGPLGYDYGTLPSIEAPAESTSGSSSGGGNSSFDNVNIAYLNNTQVFTGINRLMSLTDQRGPLNYSWVTCAKGQVLTQADGSSGNYTVICQTFTTTLNVTNLLELGFLRSNVSTNITAKFNFTNDQYFFGSLCNATGSCFSLSELNASSSSGGNPFDQNLNRTSNVTFNVLNSSRLATTNITTKGSLLINSTTSTFNTNFIVNQPRGSNGIVFGFLGGGTDGVSDDSGGIYMSMSHNGGGNRQLILGSTDYLASPGSWDCFRWVFVGGAPQMDGVRCDGGPRRSIVLGTDTSEVVIGSGGEFAGFTAPSTLTVIRHGIIPLQQWRGGSNSFDGKVLAELTANATLLINGTYVSHNASSFAGKAMCWATGGVMGHCTSAVDISGGCTCVPN